MPEASDEDPFRTPPSASAAASALLPPPPPEKEPIPPEYALSPSSKYWYNSPSFTAPIPGTNDSYDKPNPHYRDLRALEDASATQTAQLDIYHTHQEAVQIASAENIVAQLRTKQAIRKREVAKTQRFRVNQLRDRALEQRERDIHNRELAFATTVTVPADIEIVEPTESQSDLLETASV
jgi:hypothetical protein